MEASEQLHRMQLHAAGARVAFGAIKISTWCRPISSWD